MKQQYFKKGCLSVSSVALHLISVEQISLAVAKLLKPKLRLCSSCEVRVKQVSV